MIREVDKFITFAKKFILFSVIFIKGGLKLLKSKFVSILVYKLCICQFFDFANFNKGKTGTQ